nr:ammonium transporter [Natroniella sulfidigena]
MWTLLAAFLVFFMQAGFAMVEAGFSQAKNTGNIIMKNLMDFSVGSLIYWICGFAFMFGAGNNFIGLEGFFLSGGFEHLGLEIPISAFWIFQAVFAATAATIVSGAMAGRTKFSGYLVYSIVITGFIYPVVGHWIWGGGWLSEMIDFAGSTVVHSVGGWAALAGAIVLGPRLGKYNEDGSINAIPGHNLLMAALGVFILWFGWFGFNAGSTVAGTDLSIAEIAVTTNLSAATGATLAMITSWIKYGNADVSMTLNGALAGLVGITAGTANVSNLGAIIIGGLAGVLVIFAIELIDQLHVDDPVGAIAVHGVCGSFGTLMVGLLAVERGYFYGGGIELLLIQARGVVSVAIWTFLTAFLLFKGIDLVIGLRVSEKEEIEGLDLAEHGASTYSDFGAASWETIEKVLVGLKKMAQGDFSTRLDTTDDGEAGLLSTFNRTNQRVSSLITDLTELIEILSNSSQELSTSAQKGNSITESTAGNVTEMAASIQQISASSQQVSSLAQQAAAQTELGSDSLSAAIKQMEEINSSIEEGVDLINQLNNNSAEIEEIVNFITNIAEQTNLLALNASIEAARASFTTESSERTRRGEAGKGFAVVADEIRALADNTNQATDKIANLIRETLNKSESSLQAVLDIEEKAEEGKDIIEDAGESFEEIEDYILNTSVNIQQTSADTQELSIRGEKIKDDTDEINQISQDLMESSQTLAEMVEKIEVSIAGFNV